MVTTHACDYCNVRVTTCEASSIVRSIDGAPSINVRSTFVVSAWKVLHDGYAVITWWLRALDVRGICLVGYMVVTRWL